MYLFVGPRKSLRLNSSSIKWLYVTLVLFLLGGFLLIPQVIIATPSGGLAEVWQRAREAGSYHFSTDVRQVTSPQATIRNVGRESKVTRMYLEGETDLASRLLYFTLWTQGGSVLDASSGLEIKVEGEQAFARQGTQPWEEVNNFAGMFAPQGDFMAYLAAAKDVQIDREWRFPDGDTGEHYAFRIDGPSYAAYMRDELERIYVQKGELPPGIALDMPQQYTDMTGDGELWVGANGLPVRQILHLSFPPRPDEQVVTAEITVDFGFSEPQLGIGPRWGVVDNISHITHYASHFMLSLACFTLFVLLLVCRRSKVLYTAVVLTVVLSMLVSPLLQSVRAAAFVDSQAARSREQDERAEESEMQKTLQSILVESDYQPNQNPLTDARQDLDSGSRELGTLDAGLQATAMEALTAMERGHLACTSDNSDNDDNDDNANDCDPDDPADTDEDGLTDGNECVLGTNPDVEDSDGDGVNDGDEIAGFDYAGKTWYGDPLALDSNSDGLGDGHEWNAGREEGEVPPDTDEDGVPNLFDDDNDGDGVPDDMDISPYYNGVDNVFTADDPFQLIVDELEPNMPTFVEFQLRPTDPDHLWYALNVLDWPDGDVQGQIQDSDGATFYDMDNDTDRNPNDNGDVKLVPMLEIKISGDPDNLPPAEECEDDDGETYTCYPDLEPYGVFVQELNDSGDKAAYVPLQLVVDRDRDERVAFAGKMHYLPAAEWGAAHQVRLVWSVKALVDVCEEYEDGRCVAYGEMNQVQIIHTYNDEWFLTGLDVREDHGVAYDIIYEDPAADDDIDDDSILLYLTYGLEKTFLAGSDCDDIDDKGTDDPDDDVCIEGDGARDITTAEIYRRWNHTTTTASESERWSLRNHMSVVTYTYETMDEALYTLAVTETKAILDKRFSDHTSAIPTLLFAREESYRGGNLDQSTDDDVEVVQWSEDNPNQLTLKLSDDDAPVEVVAGLNWAPYRYKDGEWEAYPIEDYWDELHDRYTADFANEYDDDDDPEAARGGAVIVGQTYYLSLYVGVSVNVQSGDDLLTTKDYQTYDKPLWSTLSKAGGTAVLFVVNMVIMKDFYESTKALKMLYTFIEKEKLASYNQSTWNMLKDYGRGIKNFVTKWSSSARGIAKLGLVMLGVVVLLAAVIVGLCFLVKYYLAENLAAKIVAAVLVGVIMLYFTVIAPILQTINLILTFKAAVQSLGQTVTTFQATKAVLRSSAKFIGAAKVVAIVGLIISIGIAWGIFIYVLCTEDIPANSVAFDMLLAQTIAATIVAILMFALSLTIVGTIIVAIISLIDIVLIILGTGWTITGWVTEVITKALFSYELAIDVDADDLVAMGGLDTALVNAGKGMVEGAEMEFSTTFTTTITHEDPDDWRTRAYMWMYSKDQLRSTTFKYKLHPSSTSLSADLGDVRGDWTVRYDHKLWGHKMYTAQKTNTPSTKVTLEAGINHHVDLNLSSAYAIPGVECWTLILIIPWPPIYLPIPVCYEKGVDGSASDTVGPVVLDVLPDTLDEFVDVAGWASGMVFRDADGDGLLSQHHKGNDPDDTTWDTDGDGLSDAWELDKASIPAGDGGQFFDPRDKDTDNDNLDDGLEARLGTNPNHPDSDGDTISDYAETQEGWTFTYAEGRRLRIYSDPLDADNDGDGMDDKFERTLHTCPDCDPLENRYHPYVWNTSPIGLYTGVDDPDDVVRPDQTFVYTTTVVNELKPDLWVRGNTELDPDLLTGGPLGMFFDIARDQAQTLYANLTVPSGASNQDIELVTTMEAQLHTPSVWAWDPNQASLTDTVSALSGVAISPVDKWTSPYAVAALMQDRVYVYPATADGVNSGAQLATGVSGDASNAAPDIACNDDGVCLIVWTAHNGSEHSFRWRRILPTAQLTGTVESIVAPAGEQTYGGAVASSGQGFLAVWSVGDATNRVLMAGSINEYGTVSSPTLTLDRGLIGGMDVAYAFDRYYVTWERAGDLYAAEVYGTQVTTSAIAVTDAVEDEPRIAYDTLGQRALIVYRRATGDSSPYMLARVFAGGYVGEPTILGQTGRLDASMSPAVSADPINGGWIVAWRPESSGNTSIRYQAVGMNGELRGRRQTFWGGAHTPVLDLACAEPHPVVQLLFEEDAGADDFADSSGFGNDGYCIDDSTYDCPISGAGGQEGNAVQFDGDKDTVFVEMDVSETAYAMTAWFKADCQTCGFYEVTNGYCPGCGTGSRSYNADRTIYLKNGNICARLGNRFGGSSNSCGAHENCELICSSGVNYGDGYWHQVAHTFGGVVGGQRLYVDGELVASGEQDFSDYTGQDRLRIGYGEYQYGKYFDGMLDAVTVYPRALSDGEIRDAYRAALVIYAFDEPEGATNFENTVRNGYAGSCDGSECPTAGVGGRAYAAAQFDGKDDAISVGNQERTVFERFFNFNRYSTNDEWWPLWSNEKTSTTPEDGRKFLGRYGNETATLNLSALPSHDKIEVEFDIFIINSWDGNAATSGPDYWELQADDARQFRTTFANNNPPYYYQAYPDQFQSPTGVTVKGQRMGSGALKTWRFTSSNANVLEIAKLTEVIPESDTVSWFYWNSNYQGYDKGCDGRTYNEDGTGCPVQGNGMVVGSVQLWAATNPGRTGAVESGSLGYEKDSVYHIQTSLDHIADTLKLDFQASGLESLDNESWGIDNVRVRAINSNVPLANVSFTAAFWAQRDAAGEGYIISQGEKTPNQGLHIGFRDYDTFTCGFYDDDLNADSYLFVDDDWHHWACTYDIDTRERAIYFDGDKVAQDTASADYTGVGPLNMGRGLWNGERSFNGRVDELAIWRDALTGDEIAMLYDKVMALDDSVTECALPRARQDRDQLYINRLAVRETTTFLGKAEQETSDTLTIDRTAPNSTITSLANGAVLNINGTLVIGGESRDNTFVTQVDVRVDGGPWQTADGVETWTYEWDTGGLAEGDYTIESRATDAGGNVETSFDSVMVNIDRTSAQLTADAPPQKANQDGEGNWFVPLSGTVTDVNPQTVEVLLQGRDDAASGLGWQEAAVAGSSWNLNYYLSDFDNNENALANPTGVYTLSLRAEDVPGNQTPETDYSPLLELDNTAPETALTFPFTDTGALTDTARFITGVITDVGSVAYGVAGVEIAFVNSEDNPPVINWHNALLVAPGNITSTWAYTLPTNMEGFYKIYVRGTDVVGNRNDRQSTWELWQGVIDTSDPYVDALVDYGVMGTVPPLTSGSVVTYSEVTCQARDLTLDITKFTDCPCDPSVWQLTTYDEVSPWYRETFSDTTHIYQVDAHCLHLGDFVIPPTVKAYDAAGRHSQTVMSETLMVRLLDSAIFTPTDGVVLTTTSAFNTQGRAVAIPWGIGTITVTVNDAVWKTHNYGGSTANEWMDSFNPVTYNYPGDGRYRFLSVVSEHNNPAGNKEQMLLHPVTITVDSLPASTPTFTHTVITTAHRVESGSIFLTGVTTDIVGIDRVEMNRDGEGWMRAAHDGTTWRGRWTHDDSESDNVTYTVSTRAIDLVGRISPATETVTFDMVLPTYVTVTMNQKDKVNPFLYYPINSEQIVTDTHTLRMSWTSATDGAGVSHYLADWTTTPTATTSLSYTTHTGAATYTVTRVIDEAQTVYACVTSIDNNGNRREQTEGPIYVDSPWTPDIIDLDYHGWMDSGCSLLGVDRRIEGHAMTGASLSEEQRFYTTWNSDTLRMAWEGANWDYEGDLFIYFDTVAGGATTLYNPYTTTPSTTIYLPGNFPTVDDSTMPEYEQIRHTYMLTPLLESGMAADYLLWVETELSATLMAWNGSAWITNTVLSAEQYQWDNGLTDLSLPFNMLGITSPSTSTLSMLAVASEDTQSGIDNDLRLWATMPHRNLVNSELVVNPLNGTMTGEQVFVLVRPYRWQSLGTGQCPNDPLNSLFGMSYPDNDLRVSIYAAPVGTAYALHGDAMYRQWKNIFLGNGPTDRQFDFLDHNHRPLGQGSTVAYVISVANRGTSAAADVKAFVSAYNALSFPGGSRDEGGYREYQVVDFGAIPPGVTIPRVITGVIEVENNWRYTNCLTSAAEEVCRPLLEWAALDGLVFDNRNPLTPTVDVSIPLDAPLEWVWVDHPVDLEPPQPVGIDMPRAVVRPLTNTVSGYANDPSGVPLVEVQIRNNLSATTSIVCPDVTLDDGRWSCPWYAVGSDGDEFDLRARATDSYGHTSAWTSPWRTVVLDSTPPTITLDADAQEAVNGQLIGPEGYLLTGVFTDNHSAGTVQACRDTIDGTLCDLATLVPSTQSPTDTARLYDDVPGSPIAIGADCLTRTFTVNESFFAADVDLGVTTLISNREELVLDLFSPAGTSARLIAGLGNDLNVYMDYDVWLDDAAVGNLHNSADDDPTAPYFDRPAYPDASLDVFNGEHISGTWTLRMCDLLPLVNQGYYTRAQLSLTPQSNALSSAGTWAYRLPTPERMDGVTQTLAIYSMDALGNQLATPLSLTYRLDTVPPALTVTTILTEAQVTVHSSTASRNTRLMLSTTAPVLSGTVSDGDELEAVYLRVDPPDGASYRDTADLDGESWSYTPRFTRPGTYTLWLEPYDRAGNVTVDGPYEVSAVYTAVQSVGISGPARVLTGTPATLQAVYLPADATGVEYRWDDGSTGDSITRVWPFGSHTVVLTATDVGDNAVTGTHELAVVCPVVDDVYITGPAYVLTDTAITLYGDYAATEDITGGVTLEWDNGILGDSAVYTWPEVGTYTVVLTATGHCGAPVTTTHTVTVTDVCVPVQSVEIQGPGTAISGTAVSLSVVHTPDDATGVTYLWDNGDRTESTTYTWPAGTYTVVVTATGACGNPMSATHTVEVIALPPGCVVPVSSVELTGPTTGIAGSPYAFTAAAVPSYALPPVTYAWQPTPGSSTLLSGSSVATYTWDVSGDYVITVTAANCGISRMDTHRIHIVDGQSKVYLPVIMREN